MPKTKKPPQPPNGGLVAQGHGHDGTEQAFTRQLVGQLRGEKGTDAGLHFQGGTMNHLGLARVSGYAFDADAGRAGLVDFLQAQVDPAYESFAGHLSYVARNEINTSSHWAWHGFWAGAAWLLALRRGDREILALIRLWWRHELALQSLGVGPRGDVELPGARDFHYPSDTADQRKQRNVCRALALGQRVVPPRMAGSVDGGPQSTDMACIWVLLVLRKEFPQETQQMSGIGDSDLPVLRDPMQAIYTETESVVWFDAVTDGFDVCWWVNRRSDGSAHYGFVQGARQAPGGPRPASVPEPPAVVGRETRRISTPRRPSP